MLTMDMFFLLADASAAPSISPVRLLTIFVLGIYIGVEVITKIPPTLHTPLMSGSNAISGITLMGAILAAGIASYWLLIPSGPPLSKRLDQQVADR